VAGFGAAAAGISSSFTRFRDIRLKSFAEFPPQPAEANPIPMRTRSKLLTAQERMAISNCPWRTNDRMSRTSYGRRFVLRSGEFCVGKR
jgi:hypothetical protein